MHGVTKPLAAPPGVMVRTSVSPPRLTSSVLRPGLPVISKQPSSARFVSVVVVDDARAVGERRCTAVLGDQRPVEVDRLAAPGDPRRAVGGRVARDRHREQIGGRGRRDAAAVPELAARLIEGDRGVVDRQVALVEDAAAGAERDRRVVVDQRVDHQQRARARVRDAAAAASGAARDARVQQEQVARVEDVAAVGGECVPAGDRHPVQVRLDARRDREHPRGARATDRGGAWPPSVRP